MNKKPYEAPVVIKVRLEIKNAVLAVCHSSPNLTPKQAPISNCAFESACYNT